MCSLPNVQPITINKVINKFIMMIQSANVEPIPKLSISINKFILMIIITKCLYMCAYLQLFGTYQIF